jgi:hypothetical protein
MAQATALKPRHGCRVSFDRLSLRCFPWRLPISGSGTPVRPRGMLDSVGVVIILMCIRMVGWLMPLIASGRGWFWRFLVLELARMIGG